MKSRRLFLGLLSIGAVALAFWASHHSENRPIYQTLVMDQTHESKTGNFTVQEIECIDKAKSLVHQNGNADWKRYKLSEPVPVKITHLGPNIGVEFPVKNEGSLDAIFNISVDPVEKKIVSIKVTKTIPSTKQ